MADVKIKIVDEGSKSFVYNDIKDLVVKINKIYYWRSSHKIVKIREKNNRYFRKASPFVVVDYAGEYRLKTSCVQLDDGSWILNSPDTVVKDYKGNFIKRDEAYSLRTKGGNTFISRKSNEWAYCVLSCTIVLKDEAVILAALSSDRIALAQSDLNERNKGVLYVEYSNLSRGRVAECIHDGKLYAVSEMTPFGSNNSNQMVYKKNVSKVKDIVLVMRGYTSKSGDFTNLDLMYISDSKNQYTLLEELGLYVLKTREEEYRNDWELFVKKQKSSGLLKTYKDICKLTKESNPEILISKTGRANGGQDYYKPKIWEPTISKTTKRTGGKGYTYGIEIETEGGIVPDHVCEKHMFKKVGDGSLHNDSIDRMCFEYVSNVLHGDKGIGRINNFLDVASRYTLQGARSSTHIHVGGFKGCQTPNFTKEFSVLCIKLGSQIENDLFATLPAYRDPHQDSHAARYCQRINDYYSMMKKKPRSGVSKSKHEESVLAQFIFGPDVLEFDRRHNKSSQLGRWTRGRYKWLNLVNCNTDNSGHGSREARFETVEFRCFPGTYSPLKMQSWILICLGFVWFVENRPLLINKGRVTLKSMLREAYGNRNVMKILKDYLMNGGEI